MTYHGIAKYEARSLKMTKRNTAKPCHTYILVNVTLASQLVIYQFVVLPAMNHPLNNPAWNALNTGNKNVAFGNEKAKFYQPEVSLFTGMPQSTTENFDELYKLTPDDGFFGYVSMEPMEIPAPWKIIQPMECYQMVCEGDVIERKSADATLVPLTTENVPAMLALTKLTNPGPFSTRTIELGHYRGIFDGDKLVAMAGQRMNPTPYAEISAVCTHPHHLGKGYAAQLLIYQARRIKAAGEIPFLHVLTTNTRAISVYESLGFMIRKKVVIYGIKKS